MYHCYVVAIIDLTLKATLNIKISPKAYHSIHQHFLNNHSQILVGQILNVLVIVKLLAGYHVRIQVPTQLVVTVMISLQKHNIQL